MDADGDGYDNGTAELCAVTAPDGYSNTTNGPDCNDNISAINSKNTWYRDPDGDGFGNPAETTESCVRVPGYVDNADDCDDTKALYSDNDGTALEPVRRWPVA